MRPLIQLAALAAAAGCAGTGSAVPDTTPRAQTIVTSSETGVMVGDAPHGSTATLAAPVASVWAAAKLVFAQLDVPVTVDHPATHQLGNPEFIRSRQLAGQPMSALADCGTGTTGPKAASYRMTLSLLLGIAADAKGGTDVAVTFVAAGQDISGDSNDRITCGSTGRLEELVLERMKALSAAP